MSTPETNKNAPTEEMFKNRIPTMLLMWTIEAINKKMPFDTILHDIVIYYGDIIYCNANESSDPLRTIFRDMRFVFSHNSNIKTDYDDYILINACPRRPHPQLMINAWNYFPENKSAKTFHGNQVFGYKCTINDTLENILKDLRAEKLRR